MEKGGRAGSWEVEGGEPVDVIMSGLTLFSFVTLSLSNGSPFQYTRRRDEEGASHVECARYAGRSPRRSRSNEESLGFRLVCVY